MADDKAQHPNQPVIDELKAAVSTVIEDGEVRVYLTRRNLEALLSKLDANRAVPNTSQCTLVKNDTLHPKYPQTHKTIVVKALENEEYYSDRTPGEMHQREERRISH